MGELRAWALSARPFKSVQMSENNKKNQSSGSENYYELKTDAVNRLVNAESVPQPKKMTVDPGREYRSKNFLAKIPNWVKILFIKFWFNGAACFFIFWGLGMLVPDILDMIVIFGIVLGLITDIFVNNILRFVETYPGQNKRWMLISKKSNWTIFPNMAYSILVLFCVFYLYNFINYAIIDVAGGEFMIGVEPIAFGFLYLVVDMFFISIKNMIVSIVADAMAQNGVKPKK
jgi:hypothetical protein